MAYVFIHLLPEPATGSEVIEQISRELMPPGEYKGFNVALFGLVFYGLGG